MIDVEDQRRLAHAAYVLPMVAPLVDELINRLKDVGDPHALRAAFAARSSIAFVARRIAVKISLTDSADLALQPELEKT
jgi:hypothetical protein